MRFIPWLWRLVSNFGFIIRQEHSHGRMPMLRAYAKIELKRFFLAGVLRRKINKESLFGYQIHFFDYHTFATLFEELYVADVYYFSTSSQEPLVIDCGSNIGLAILYFKRIHPKCRVIGFEPDKATFGMLERNVRTNRLANVTLVNKALHAAEGSLPFYFQTDHPGLLVQSTRKESVPRAEVTSVETTMLSRYVNQPVDFLKMDIEGAEEEVLRDLSETGKLPLVREMVLEYHHHVTPEEDNLGVFLKMLENGKFGYQLKAPLAAPFHRGEFQAFLLYVYSRDSASSVSRPLSSLAA